MVEEPVVPVMISQLVSKFKELVKKVTYDKSEIDSKLNGKASNTLVSSSANGLMSSVDKTKLDGIDEEANKIVVDSAMSSSSVNPVQNKIVHQELGNKSDINHTHDDMYYTESEMDTKLNAKANTTVASTSANGLMSSADKVKLDGVEEGANKIVVDSAMSESSVNPVQNKVVKAELDSLNSTKANTNHTHGVTKQTSTIADNTFLTQLGNLAIFSWWTGDINISSANTWTDVWTLPVTNKGKTVWSNNIYHGAGSCWLRVAENSNKVQAFASKTGSIPIHSGELIFFIE